MRNIFRFLSTEKFDEKKFVAYVQQLSTYGAKMLYWCYIFYCCSQNCAVLKCCTCSQFTVNCWLLIGFVILYI